MNQQNDVIRVERVVNGWILSGNTRAQYREGYTSDVEVARNPEELSKLIFQWAASQEKEEQ